MPNVTPEAQLVKYNLYDRKTLLRDRQLDDVLHSDQFTIGFGQWGDAVL